jgi:hypothetical protein
MPGLPVTPSRRLIGGLLAAAALAACDGPGSTASVPPPPAGFQFASAAPDCAPWDGPAVTILLSNHPGSDTAGIAENVRPLIRVVLYPRGTGVTGQKFHWPADPEMAVGQRCPAEGECETASDGEVDVLPSPADSALEGSLRLHFPDGTTVSGGFHATWHPRRMLCG